MTFAGNPTLAIIGGGLAGTSAALAAAEVGCRVELFEQAELLGGRAGSYRDPDFGRLIDYCQHVALGCCREFRDFCRRAGLENCFQRSPVLQLIAPSGKPYSLTAARWLPGPLARLPGLLRLGYLTRRERMGIVKTLYHLSRSDTNRDDAQAAFGDWLQRQNRTPKAMDYFWSPIVVSALAETVENVAFTTARKVFCEAFMTSREGGELFLPQLPLGEIFHHRLAAPLNKLGVKVHCGVPVKRLEGDRSKVRSLVTADGARLTFDLYILAVPWHKVRKLLTEKLLSAMPDLTNIEQLPPAEITAVHLWFDRPVIPLSHAMLIGRSAQWVFCRMDEGGQYCQAVISATHRQEQRTLADWSAEVRRELAALWPAVAQSRLLHEKTFVQPRAVFSPTVAADRRRPAQQTPIENLALAGDWTQTGWPATMESAVISGRRAANALLGRTVL